MLSLMRSVLCICMILLLLLPANAQDWNRLENHPLNGKAFTGTGDPVTMSDILNAAASSKYILIGETHDNPDHHRIQAGIIASLASEGTRPALVLEMIPFAMQPRLDAFLADSSQAMAVRLEELGELLEWEARGWPDWNIYAPVARAALQFGMPLLAGNLDHDLIRTIGREGLGLLGEATVRRFGLTTSLSPKQQEGMLKELDEGHCGLMPAEMLQSMISVQRARDGAMAASLVSAANRHGKALLIAGSSHARVDRGVPFYVSHLDSGNGVTSVGLLSVRQNAQAFADYRDGAEALPYDFVIFTDAAPPVDHCKELRELFGKSGTGGESSQDN